MELKIAKLLNVTDKNNNKFYDMTQTSSDNFNVSFGRVGATPQTASYPMRQWNAKYQEKLKKGYTDVTDLYKDSTAKATTLTTDERLNEMLGHLIKVSQLSFSQSYAKGVKITQFQVAHAQEILNDITFCTDLAEAQRLYLKLFTTIPRAMSDVRYYLPNTLERAKELVGLEQKTLDNALVQSSYETTTEENLLDKLGINMTVGEMNKEIEEILQGETRKVKKVTNLHKPITEEAFNQHVAESANRKTILAWHGTAEQNVLSICSLSLRVRPTNVANGSMLGLAAYVSQEFRKSYNYTSGVRRFMFIYQVHVGNELIANSREKIRQYTLEELERLGYDSVYAPAGVNTGRTHLNYSERTVYRSEQLTPKYLLEVE